MQFVQSVFVEKYDPTIEDSYRKVIERPDNPKGDLALDILDTAGTEQFTAMRDMYMKSGDGFLLVYSLTSPATLHDLHALRERLARVKPTAKVVLVGNKADLVGERVVGRGQGEAVAVKWGCPFVETSAKDAGSVERAFMTLVDVLEKPSGVCNAESNQSDNNDNNGKRKKKCIIA